MEISIETIYKNPQQQIKISQNYLFCGTIYECNFNMENKFSASQLCVVLDLPSEYNLEFFRKIEVLVFIAGLQDLEYNVTKIKYEYLKEIWVVQKIGISPERVQKRFS